MAGDEMGRARLAETLLRQSKNDLRKLKRRIRQQTLECDAESRKERRNSGAAPLHLSQVRHSLQHLERQERVNVPI